MWQILGMRHSGVPLLNIYHASILLLECQLPSTAPISPTSRLSQMSRTRSYFPATLAMCECQSCTDGIFEMEKMMAFLGDSPNGCDYRVLISPLLILYGAPFSSHIYLLTLQLTLLGYFSPEFSG